MNISCLKLPPNARCAAHLCVYYDDCLWARHPVVACRSGNRPCSSAAELLVVVQFLHALSVVCDATTLFELWSHVSYSFRGFLCQDYVPALMAEHDVS